MVPVVAFAQRLRTEVDCSFHAEFLMLRTKLASNKHYIRKKTIKGLPLLFVRSPTSDANHAVQQLHSEEAIE